MRKNYGLGMTKWVYGAPTPRMYYERTGKPMTSEVKKAYMSDPNCRGYEWHDDDTIIFIYKEG